MPRSRGERLAGSLGCHGPPPTTTKDPVCPIPSTRLQDSDKRSKRGGGRCWPRKEEPFDQRGPQSYTLQPLPWGIQGPRSCLLPLQLLLQLGTPRSTPVDTAVTCLPQV